MGRFKLVVAAAAIGVALLSHTRLPGDLCELSNICFETPPAWLSDVCDDIIAADESRRWHQGPEWAAFLEEYESVYTATLGQCERKLILTRFGRTFVHECGTRNEAAVLFFHGATCTSTIWEGVVAHEALAQKRLVLVDHICDAGKSVPTRCPFSAADHAVWLADVQKGLGIQTSDLVGYSLGAYATGLMKLAQPDRVGRLVHAGPAAVYGPFNSCFFARVLVAGLARAWPDVGRYTPARKPLDMAWLWQFMTAPTYDVYETPPPQLALHTRSVTLKKPRGFPRPREFSDAELLLLNTTAVIYPEFETITHKAIMKRRANEAGIPFIEIAASGHGVPFERPRVFADAIASALLD